MRYGTFSEWWKSFQKGEAMYKVIEKEILNPTVTKMVVEAPAVAKKALAGKVFI